MKDYKWSEDGNTILERNWGRKAVQTQIKFLQGKILTIVEASTADKLQRRALISLVNQEFSKKLKYIEEASQASEEDALGKPGVILESARDEDSNVIVHD